MDFASRKAYISKSKMDKQSALIAPDRPEAKSEGLPMPPPAGYAPPPPPPASMSVIREEEEDRSAMEEVPMKLERKNSFCAIRDEELDRFHSDEDDEGMPSPPPPAAPAPEPKKKSGGGFFAAIGSLFGSSSSSSSKAKLKDAKEEEKAKKDKKKRRVESHLARKGRRVAESAPIYSESVPLSAVQGSAGREHRKEIDTNVLRINMNVLKNMGSLATGDPVNCARCQAYMSMFSRIDVAPDKEQTWVCEFCNSPNKVSIEEEEKITKDDVTYVIESAQQSMLKKGGGENISLVFCIDVSGSMCVTQAVEGKTVKYDKVKKIQDLMKFSDGSYQYLEGERSGQTYISRMQCVQVAIEHQLTEMANGAPKRKVGLVTFNNEVNLIGDGIVPSKVIAGDKLHNYEDLLMNAEKDGDVYLSKPIADTKKGLVAKLAELEEGGQTALGPALLVSLGVAMRGDPGSRVIVCTDGLANVGLGSIEQLNTEEEFNKAKEFYTKVGELAKTKGISISIISIVGDECRLEMISPLADLTGGDILKVDPTNLQSDFANILSDAIIATNVETRVRLHKGLTFRNEDAKTISKDGTLMVRELGNAYENQELTLEYCVKTAEELEKLPDVDMAKLTKLPFQAMINYQALNGIKCVRVMTKTQDVTFEREEAKKDANYDLLSVNAVQQTAKLAKEGKYRDAQANAFGWKKMLKGSEGYEDYMVEAAPLYQALERQQMEDFVETSSAPKAAAFSAKSAAQRDYVVSEANQAHKTNVTRMKKK